MNKTCTLFILFGIFFLISCRKENSEKIDQNQIWSEYRLIYRSDIDSTFMRARFIHNDVDGENLKLSDKSTILISGKSPNYNPSFMWYERITQGKDSIVDFYYSDLDGQSFSNTVSLISEAEIPETDTIYKDSVVFFPWIGNPLQEGELMLLVLDGNLSSQLPVISTDTIGASGIYLFPDSLSPLPLGEITIHFERFNIQDANGNAVGAKSYAHYISKKKEVKLVER